MVAITDKFPAAGKAFGAPGGRGGMRYFKAARLLWMRKTAWISTLNTFKTVPVLKRGVWGMLAGGEALR